MTNVYITKALRKDIPKDAVLLTKEEALAMHWEMIRNWKPQSVVWPFTYGIGVLTATNSVTNMSIVNHFRNRLKLGNYGRVTMTIPSIAVPCVAASLAHYTYVSSAILLGEDCPICIETRAAALQVGLGVFVPCLISPFAAFFYALSYGTYNVPPLRRQFLPELFKLWMSLFSKLKPRLYTALAVNGLGAMGLAYFQTRTKIYLQSELYRKEEEFRNLVESGGPRAN